MLLCNFARVSANYDSHEHDWDNWPLLQFKTIFDFNNCTRQWQNMVIIFTLVYIRVRLVTAQLKISLKVFVGAEIEHGLYEQTQNKNKTKKPKQMNHHFTFANKTFWKTTKSRDQQKKYLRNRFFSSPSKKSCSSWSSTVASVPSPLPYIPQNDWNIRNLDRPTRTLNLWQCS